MADDTVIEDISPLQKQYIPAKLVNREAAVNEIQGFFEQDSADRNHLVHGPVGTGKTVLALSQLHQSDANTCYIPGQKCRTQYQALKQLYQTIAQESISDGFHTADLKRRINEKTRAVQYHVVIDDIDFLLLNDGNDLLYHLSRTSNISLLLTSSHTEDLRKRVEERTLSSLQPSKTVLEPYTAEELQQILINRAENSLEKRSLHREALTYITSTTQNPGYALTWLKTAAQKTTTQVTENTVKNTREEAHRRYIETRLQLFTQHHQTLYQAITELVKENEKDAVNTGEIYNRYQQLCTTYTEDPLSNRRISDYLKHLELLQLIKAEYHYGGQQGKTREIKLVKPTATENQ